MLEQSTFQLIGGTFTAAEASRVLLTLVRSKIDYHRLDKLSNEERFGTDRAHSEKRLGELRELESALKASLTAAAGQTLQIEGWITINPVHERMNFPASGAAL